MAADKEPVIPGLIGNFNIPKAVIENKVDVLTFLELMVRKGIVTPEELDDIRSAVVAHLNAAFPELELSYTTPEAGSKGPFNAPAPASAPTQNASGGFANAAFNTNAPKPSIATSSMMAPMPEQKKAEGSAESATASTSAEAPKAPAANPEKPLWVQAPPPRFIK